MVSKLAYTNGMIYKGKLLCNECGCENLIYMLHADKEKTCLYVYRCENCNNLVKVELKRGLIEMIKRNIAIMIDNILKIFNKK